MLEDDNTKDFRAELIRRVHEAMMQDPNASGATLMIPTKDGGLEEFYIPRPRPGRWQ